MPELLAPAGGFEQLIASVRCGADAVYIGTKNFNARRNAKNFDKDDLKKAVSFCHARNVKVYVTFNTLVDDNEIPKVIENINDIAYSGADAAIVQDLAVAKIIKEVCPSLKIHASTQMAITNIDGVRELEKLGFSRVVLARELSFKEISEIVNSTNMEIEVFVHGALCMSVSGRCYLSSMLGDRSGNRGLCAQPCRLNFKCNNREFALSLKDMSYIDYVKKLSDIGVHSFKIEGRMKRPEYVAAVVHNFKNALNSNSYDKELLKSVFSRSGFTDGYFTGKRNVDMFGIRTKDDVIASNSVLKDISNLYKKELQSVEISCKFIAKLDSPTYLTVKSNDLEVKIQGEIPEYTEKNPINHDFIYDKISKTGGTPFVIKEFTADIGDNVFLSSSSINSLRRKALEKLLEIRSNVTPLKILDFNYKAFNKYVSKSTSIRLRFEKFEESFCNSNIEYIILPIDEILSHKEAVDLYGDKLICELPTVCFQDYTSILYKSLEEISQLGIKNVICESLSAIFASKNFGLNIFGGQGLNITNTYALNGYSKIGVNDATLSTELNNKRISSLGGNIRRGIIGYGYLPIMTFRTCPARGKDCGKCGGNNIISDRLGKQFRLSCFKRMYSNLFNCLPLYIGDKKINNVDFYTLYFTNESKEYAKSITEMFINGQPPNFERTSGPYFRKLQ